MEYALVRDLVRMDRIPIVFGRVYDSRIEKGDFGPGWKLTVSESIVGDGDSLVYTDASSSDYILERDGKKLKSRHPHITGITRGRVAGNKITIEHLGLIKTFRKFGPLYQIVNIQDRFGNTLTIKYDGGRVSKIISQNGRHLSIARDSTGLVQYAEDDLGRTVSFRYSEGLLKSHQDLGGYTWTYNYKKNKLISVIDPRGAKSLDAKFSENRVSGVRVQHDRYRFRYFEDRTRIMNSLQQSAILWHHESGLTEEAKDFEGAITRIEIDGNLNSRSLSYEGSLVASLEYDDRNKIKKLTRHDGPYPLAYIYERSGGKLRSVAVNGVRIAEYKYERSGAVRRAFDVAGQRQYSFHPDGRIASVGINNVQIELMPNELGHIGGFLIDGETIAKIEYDGADRVIAIEVGNDAATYEYEQSGFRQKAYYGDDGTTEFDYDAVGNMTKTVSKFRGLPTLISRYAVGPRNQIRSVETTPGESITFQYDEAGRVSGITQGRRFAKISRDAVGRLDGLSIDSNEIFAVNYDPMQIDVLIASDVKSNRVRTSLPQASHIFGSLDEIAYARPRGTPYGLVAFEPSMARFVMPSEPYIAPDASTYSSLTRRAIVQVGKEPFNVLAFDKPSNSLFTPPEFYSVNCQICISVVNSASMTVDGATGTVEVPVGESIQFEVSGVGTCVTQQTWPNPPEIAPWEFAHDIFYGDGGSTSKVSWITPNTEFNHTYGSAGTMNASDSISCACNSLLTLATASATVVAKCGVQNRTSHPVDGCSIPEQVTQATAVLWGGTRNNPVNGDQGLISTRFGEDQGTIKYDATQEILSLPCNQHDLCYQTCGSQRLTCDGALGYAARNVCNVAYRPDPVTVCPHLNVPITGPAQCIDWTAEKVRCPAVATAVEAAVAAAGAPAFNQRQAQHCSCGAP